MRIVVLAVSAVAACSAPAAPPQAAREAAAAEVTTAGVDGPQRGLDELPLEVRSSGGRVHRFRVEVARTARQQEIGMMFRTRVAPDRGMIFPYDSPQQVGYWMRNVPIPLDIIYVRADGTIATIANAKPLDETSLSSGEPITLVFEIAGGRAAELGIRPGDRVVVPGLPAPAAGG